MTIDYLGHPKYWIFTGFEQTLNKSLSQLGFMGTNNWITPVERLFLRTDFKNVRFLGDKNKVYFTTSRLSKSIQSTSFPDITRLKQPNSLKGILEKAESNFRNRSFPYLTLENFTVEQLFSAKDLFGLVSDTQDRPYFAKIKTDQQYGFDYNQPVTTAQVVSDHQVDKSSQIVAFDLNQSETEIILLENGESHLLAGKFQHTRRNPVKVSRILVDEVTNPVSVTLVRSTNYEQPEPYLYGGYQLAVLEADPWQIKLFDIDIVKNAKVSRYTLDKVITLEEQQDYRRVDFFFLHDPAIRELQKEELLEFLILFTDAEIYAVNLFSGKQFPLIGQGNIPVINYVSNGSDSTGRLNKLNIGQITTGYCVHELGIFFGNERQKYLLLSESAKNLFLEKKNTTTTSGNGHDLDS